VVFARKPVHGFDSFVYGSIGERPQLYNQLPEGRRSTNKMKRGSCTLHPPAARLHQYDANKHTILPLGQTRRET